MKVDLFLVLFLPLLPGMLVGVDKRVCFRHAMDDEEYAFSYSGPSEEKERRLYTRL